jgi:hypothetical protein
LKRKKSPLLRIRKLLLRIKKLPMRSQKAVRQRTPPPDAVGLATAAKRKVRVGDGEENCTSEQQ